MNFVLYCETSSNLTVVLVTCGQKKPCDTCPLLPAAILGMYTLMSNKQYYDALGLEGRIANTEGINSK